MPRVRTIIKTTTNREFVLGSLYMHEFDGHKWARMIKRSDIKRFFRLSETEIPVHYKGTKEIVNFYVQKNKGGSMEVGCMVFSAATVKKVRAWAKVE